MDLKNKINRRIFMGMTLVIPANLIANNKKDEIISAQIYPFNNFKPPSIDKGFQFCGFTDYFDKCVNAKCLVSFNDIDGKFSFVLDNNTYNSGIVQNIKYYLPNAVTIISYRTRHNLFNLYKCKVVGVEINYVNEKICLILQFDFSDGYRRKQVALTNEKT